MRQPDSIQGEINEYVVLSGMFQKLESIGANLWKEILGRYLAPLHLSLLAIYNYEIYFSPCELFEDVDPQIKCKFVYSPESASTTSPYCEIFIEKNGEIILVFRAYPLDLPGKIRPHCPDVPSLSERDKNLLLTQVLLTLIMKLYVPSNYNTLYP